MIVNNDEMLSFKTFIETCLKKYINPTKSCRAKLKSGKQCSHKAEIEFNTCKKHRNVKCVEKVIKNVVYHDHLPFEQSTTCVLCNS